MGRDRIDTSALALGVLAALWGWRLELSLVAVVLGVQRLLAGLLGEWPAALAVLVLVGMVVLVPSARRLAVEALRRAWVRRAFERAAADTGLSDCPLRAPRVAGARRVPAGDVLRVRVRRGQSVIVLDARAAGWPRACALARSALTAIARMRRSPE